MNFIFVETLMYLAVTIMDSCYNFTPIRASITVRLLTLHALSPPSTIILARSII